MAASRRWPRWPRAAGPTRRATRRPRWRARSRWPTCWASPYVADPLRAHDCAPVGDGAAAVILAAGDRARELCDRPAWITGFEHRIDSGSLGGRDLTTAPSAATAGAGGGRGRRSTWPSCTRRSRHQELLLRAALGLGDEARINPSGGALCGNPMFAAGLARIGEAAREIMAGRAGPGAGPRDQRPGAAAEPGLRAGGTLMQLGAAGGGPRRRPDASTGRRRADVSIAGPVPRGGRPGAGRRRADLADIDAVVVGKAPDLFEGVMMPELYLADALGAAGKPLLRVHTAGSVGGATGIVAASLVQAGVHRAGAGRGVREAVRVQRHVGAVDHAAVQHAAAGRGGRLLRAAHPRLHPAQRRARSTSARWSRSRTGATAPEPVRPPAAARHHAGEGAGLADAVGPGPLRRDLPVLGRRVRRGHRRPGRGRGVARRAGGLDPGHGDAHRADHVRRQGPRQPAGRRGRGGRRCGAQAGITDPRGEIDVAEIYVPFSWFEPMWLENLGFAAPGEGWQLTEAGETEIGGALPVNPSGGVLCSNPIGASGLLRFAEAALQVMGQAGEHQVAGARTALGHAYGGGSQFFSMWVVASTPD